MSNKQQTAVEQLADKIRNYKTPLNMGGVYFVLIHQDMINRFEQQAKEMEKEQMIEFTDNYVDNCIIPNENMAIPTIMDVPNYYNETYGGNE
jgi:hypothetical protein